MRHLHRGGAINGKGYLPIESNSMTTVVVPEVEVERGEVRPTNHRTKAVDVGEGGCSVGRLSKKVDANQNYQKGNILRFELGHHGGFASPSRIINH